MNKIEQKVHPMVNQKLHMDYCNYSSGCLVVWPPKLEWLGLADNSLNIPVIPNITFVNNGSMKYADVSNNNFATIPNYLHCGGPFTHNVISTIEHIDGSNCGIKCASKHIAGNCKFSVKFANASHNKIGLLDGGCNKNPKKEFLAFIKNFPSVEVLDASYNEISFLPDDPDIFEAATNVRVLIVSHNKLSSLQPANLSKLISLELLDLSYNKFRTISERTRLMLDDIDKTLQQNTSLHLSLNLLGNPLSCTCKDLQFIEWLTVTKINIINRDQYTCTYKDGTIVKMSDQLFYNLESECNDNAWLVANLVSLVVYHLLVTIATLWYRFRHYFRYLFLKMRMRQERLDAMLGRNEEYKYDAFISCTRGRGKMDQETFH